MSLIKPSLRIIEQLTELVIQLDQSTYTSPSALLSHSTLGQHIRHTLEFFICFEKGYRNGVINYDNRAHDKLIETDKLKALEALENIEKFIAELNLNKTMQLEVNYDLENKEVLTTSAIRELVYNMEHAVHHMALMKIGIKELAPHIMLSSDFGVATSTVRYKQNQTVTIQ